MLNRILISMKFNVFKRPKNWVDYTEWISTLTGLTGALLISSNIGFVGWGYVVFFISSTSFLYFAWKLERWPLFMMNFIFSIINLWGIWRWLLLPLF